MSGGLLLAIDAGSQSTKVTIFDRDGVIHAQGAAPLRPYAVGEAGEAVHPGDDVWESVVAACAVALNNSGSAGGRAVWPITAIGLCGIRFCRAVIDSQGSLVEPLLSWMDRRVSEPVGDLDPAVATIAASSGYLTARLTGQRRDSAGAYEGMWPIDQATGGWSSDPADFARTGMPRRLLPELVAPGELLGEVTREAAALTGLTQGCPVYATANDKAVEALGAGLSAAHPNAVLLSLGTYIAAMSPGRRDDAAAAPGSTSWVNTASIPGEVLHESEGVRRGMWTVSWLRNLVSSAPPGADLASTQDWLEQGAGDVPAGSEGLITLPDFLAPADAAYRRGAILGLDGRHGPHHLYRSVLEGIALRMADHATALISERGLRPTGVLVAGGGAKSDVMMQIVADCWAMPATRVAAPDAAGLGAAICAAVGSGMHASWAGAIEAMVGQGETFVADPVGVDRYRDVASRYRRAAEFTDPMFAALQGPGSG